MESQGMDVNNLNGQKNVSFPYKIILLK